MKLLPPKHAGLRGRFLVTAIGYLFISRSLPSNGSTCHNALVMSWLPKMIELAAVVNRKRKCMQLMALDDGTYEPGYIIHFVGNFTREKCSACLNSYRCMNTGRMLQIEYSNLY
jgi:hypothetical protein